MDQPPKAPTVQDVARHAGVSAATVSRVLSNPEKVSDATRVRVETAVRETGYTVNQAARTLRMQRAKTLLAVMPGIGNPYYSVILEAVVTEATHRGYGVLVTSRVADDPALWLGNYLHSNRADGLLVFDGFLDTRRLHSISGEGAALPLVAAYDELPDPQINSVVTDNQQAAERAVRHLYDLGHRRIGHITGPSRNELPNQRFVGYQKAVAELGMVTRDEWLWPGTYTMRSGVAAGEAFAGLTDRPTAVFSGNDEMAIGFLSTIRKHGIECPRDLSVIGFDDIGVSQAYSPTITTMRQPREQIGRMATQTLLDILERGDAKGGSPVRVILKSELVVRESTAPLHAQARAVG